MGRVAITGIGCVTPLGLDCGSTWEGIVAGRSGIAPIATFDAAHFPAKVAGEVKGFRPPAVDLPRVDHLPRSIQLLLTAAEEAVADAKVVRGTFNPSKAGASVGITLNCFTPMDPTDEPVHFLYRSQSVEPCLLGQLYGLRGPNLAVDTACAAGSQALGEAFRMIQRGEADLMVTGGCSSLTTPYGVMAFALLGSLSKANVSRPFDASRDGFVIAEGAGVVILEEWEHARARGARIYGELVGYGCTANAYRITDSPPDGESEAYGMALALRDAGIRPEEVDYIAAHGTSTRQNDRTETLAVKRVFGEHAGGVLVSSNKSMLGHTIAAAGVLSLIFSVLAIRDGVVPPTINYRSPDPRCDLDYVPNEARHMPVRCAMVNAFAFGGHNTTLVVRRADS